MLMQQQLTLEVLTMKTPSNITRHIGMASSLIASAVLIAAPMSVYALGSATADTTANTSPFCTELSTKSQTITNSMNTVSGKLQAAWAKQTQDLTNDFQKADQDIAADRAKADTERQTDFTKLMAKATTSSEKQAVGVYETAVLQAVNTRRTAYDNARSNYRTNVEGAISGRQTTVKGQLTVFESSVSSALSNAQSSCASTPNDGTSIRTTLVGSLKSARETFQSDRKSDSTVGTQIKQYVTTRNDAFATANSIFQTSIQNAAKTLQQAFGKTSV
jgi:hypothetical protein